MEQAVTTDKRIHNDGDKDSEQQRDVTPMLLDYDILQRLDITEHGDEQQRDHKPNGQQFDDKQDDDEHLERILPTRVGRAFETTLFE